MSRSSTALVLTLSLLGSVQPARALTAEAYAQRPKLVVLVVVDQLRGDLLTRYQKNFIPATSADKKPGFDLLMSRGAYFPFASYETLQNMTCPGHASIATGAQPARTGINRNDWFDTKTEKMQYCVADPAQGLSPRNLKAPSFGDELRSVYKNSRVFSLAIKDRSAILLGGQRASGAFWWNNKKHEWETSPYYLKGELPQWIKTINASTNKDPERSDLYSGDLKSSVAGVRATFEFANALLQNEKLGRGADSDILTISLSSLDILGHRVGPNSPDVEKLLLEIDRGLSELWTNLDRDLKLENVLLALTADHGIPPLPEETLAQGLPGGRLDFVETVAKVNQKLNEKFGNKSGQSWIKSLQGFHLHINQGLLKDRKAIQADVENEIRKIFLLETGLTHVLTKTELSRGQFTAGPLGEQMKNSFIASVDGDVILVPAPYFQDKGAHVNHITGHSYDRTVPLAVWGRNVKAGIFSDAKVVDLAPTLNFILRINPPVMNEGRVLKEIFP